MSEQQDTHIGPVESTELYPPSFGPVGPEGILPETVVPSPFIITLDELKATHEALSHKERLDKSTLYRFIEPDVEELKRRLVQWASLGLPDGFQIFSVSVQPPTKCLDGEVRDKFTYVEYLLGTTLFEKFQVIQSKLPGMLLSYSLPDSQICMHVSKA